MSLTVESVFLRANDKVKPSTLKVYRGQINKYMNSFIPMVTPEESEEAHTFKWVEDHKKVISNTNASGGSDNSQRTFYSYMKIFLRGLSNDYESLEEFKAYDKEEKRLEEVIKLTKQKNKTTTGLPLTDEQAKNLVSLDQIKMVLKTLTNEIKQINKVKNYDSDNQKIYSLYILLNTHFRFPFRNELHNLTYITSPIKYKKVKDDLTRNYLLKENKELKFIRNVYKTAHTKTSGGQKIDTLPPELAKMYNRYIKNFNIDNNEELFTHLRNSTDYTRLFTDYFKNATGKNVSSTILMKVINEPDEEGKKLLEILKSLSMKRGTTLENLLKYYL